MGGDESHTKLSNTTMIMKRQLLPAPRKLSYRDGAEIERKKSGGKEEENMRQLSCKSKFQY